MCIAALPFIMAGASMASTFSGITSRNKELSSQANQLGANAQANASSQFEAIVAGQEERLMASEQQSSRRKRLGRKERATLEAQQANENISGNTFARQFIISKGNEGEDLGIIELNRSHEMAQGERMKRGVLSEFQGSVNQIRSLKNQQTPAWSAILQTGLAGFQGYTAGKTAQAQFGGSGSLQSSPVASSVPTAVSGASGGVSGGMSPSQARGILQIPNYRRTVE